MMSMAESCGDACLSIPSSSPLKAPRIRQRKRGPLLSLSLLAASVSLGLSPSLSPALCSSLSADAPTTQQQLLTGHKFRKSLQVCKQRQSATHLRAVCSARVAVRRGKSLRGHIQLCVVESPFVYTCDRWMGLLLAAPSSFRSPKSPALSKSNNYTRKTGDMSDH